MIHKSKWFASAIVALSLGLWLDVATLKATEAFVGTVSGTVTDKDGQKVEGVKVRIVKPRERGEGAGRDGARRPQGDRTSAGNDAPPPPPPAGADAPPPPPADAPRPPAGDGSANRGDNPRGPENGDRPRRPREGEGSRLPPPPSAEGYTDKEGNFSLNVPSGEYVVVVMERDKGFAHSPVSVEAEKTATVSLKLEERPPGDAPRRDGGDRGGRAGSQRPDGPHDQNQDQPRGERPPKPE